MPEVDVYDQSKKKVSKVTLGSAWEAPIRKGSVYEVALWHLNARRKGTASTKTRSEVRGSGRKIYRQKGTGSARHGDRQAPIFVGGGVASGPKPKDWSTRITQKTRRQAVKSALIHKYCQDRLRVLEKLEFKEIKTKQAKKLFDKWSIESALLVLDQPVETVIKSIRNLPFIKTCSVNSLNLADLLTHDYLVVTKAALKKIEERWVVSESKK